MRSGMTTYNNALNSSKEPVTHTKKISDSQYFTDTLWLGEEFESQINPNQPNTNPRNYAKRQSQTTVLLRTPITHMILFNHTNLVMLDKHGRQLSIASFEFPNLFRMMLPPIARRLLSFF